MKEKKNKVKAVVDEIYQNLERLNRGSQYSGAGFKSLAYATRASRDERVVADLSRVGGRRRGHTSDVVVVRARVVGKHADTDL